MSDCTGYSWVVLPGSVRGLCRFTCPAPPGLGAATGRMGAAMLGAWPRRHGLESEVRAFVIRDRDGRIPGTGYRDFLVGCVHRGEQEHRARATTPRGPVDVESAPVRVMISYMKSGDMDPIER